MKKIQAECDSCGGTGLYQGFAEPEGEAVICLTCNGTGASTITYKPYTGRKTRRGVKCVRRSRGSFIATGIGGVGTSMTYNEFCNKVAAAKPE